MAEISISVGELQTRKVMIATPMYGGACAGQYTKSSVDLGVMATKYGMDMRFFYIFNESLITRARNYLVDEFLRSDCTHLMFIDSDIGFDANDVIAAIAIADPNSDKDIVCAPYPKKCISWEKIKRAVDKGFADRNPNKLENYVGDFVFNPVGGTDTIELSQPVEVLESGTGFMCIQRRVFERMAAAYPHQTYLPDHVRTEHFDGTREIQAYFDCVIDPATKRYLSEDYMFCQYARNIGLKVWLCPWIKLSHIGSYIFAGSLLDLAQIGASPTADVNVLKGTKKGK
jgi:hypothetical protein